MIENINIHYDSFIVAYINTYIISLDRPAKMLEIGFVEDEVRGGQGRVRTIDKLDGGCINANDGMITMQLRMRHGLAWILTIPWAG